MNWFSRIFQGKTQHLNHPSFKINASLSVWLTCERTDSELLMTVDQKENSRTHSTATMEANARKPQCSESIRSLEWYTWGGFLTMTIHHSRSFTSSLVSFSFHHFFLILIFCFVYHCQRSEVVFLLKIYSWLDGLVLLLHPSRICRKQAGGFLEFSWKILIKDRQTDR